MENNTDTNIINDNEILTNLDQFDLSDIVPGDDAILIGKAQPVELNNEDDNDE